MSWRPELEQYVVFAIFDCCDSKTLLIIQKENSTLKKHKKNPNRISTTIQSPIYIPTGSIVNAFDMRKNILFSRLFMFAALCTPCCKHTPRCQIHAVTNNMCPVGQASKIYWVLMFFSFAFFVKLLLPLS